MTDKAIDNLPGLRQPSYAEVFAEFIDRYGRQVDDSFIFSREVGRLIGIAQHAAVEPLQKVLQDSLNRFAVVPLTFREMDLKVPELDYRWIELWRGQHRGTWFRVVLANSMSSLQFQMNTGMDTSPEHECWIVVANQ